MIIQYCFLTNSYFLSLAVANEGTENGEQLCPSLFPLNAAQKMAIAELRGIVAIAKKKY
ncbi:MAG: hypothetical protein QNJ54_20340 [Prochloraceae cyanobacterium]|nr:hypothetical protein [Prochloraceae cyanobacterium]